MPYSTAKPVSRLTPDERRMQLLLFGQEFFAHNQFDSLTMKELAIKAGVSKGLLYHYFGNRLGYYLATLRFVMEEIIVIFDALPRNEGASVRKMLSALTDYFLKTCHLYLTSVQSGNVEVRGEVRLIREVVLNKALEIRGVKINSSIGNVALHGWLAFCESAISNWLEDSGIKQSELVNLLLYQLDSSLQMLQELETN